MGTHGKINAIWWNIKINLQKMVDICGYELTTNLQNLTQKYLTEVKIFQKVWGGGATLFWNTLYVTVTDTSLGLGLQLITPDACEMISSAQQKPHTLILSFNHEKIKH